MSECYYKSDGLAYKYIEGRNKELREVISSLRVNNLSLKFEVKELIRGSRLKLQEEANFELSNKIYKLEVQNKEGRDAIDQLTRIADLYNTLNNKIIIEERINEQYKIEQKELLKRIEELKLELLRREELVMANRELVKKVKYHESLKKLKLHPYDLPANYQLEMLKSKNEKLKEEVAELKEQAKVDKELNANWVCHKCYEELRPEIPRSPRSFPDIWLCKDANCKCHRGLPDDMFKVT